MGRPDSSLVLWPMNDLVEEVRGSFKILFHVESIEKYHLLPMNDLVEEVRGSFEILFHVESIEKYHFIIFDTTSDELLQNYNL